MTSSAAKRKHNFILNVRYDIFVRSSTPIQLMNLLLESSMFTRLSKYFRGPKNLSHLLSRFIKRHWLIDVHHFKSALNFPFTSYNSVNKFTFNSFNHSREGYAYAKRHIGKLIFNVMVRCFPCWLSKQRMLEFNWCVLTGCR